MVQLCLDLEQTTCLNSWAQFVLRMCSCEGEKRKVNLRKKRASAEESLVQQLGFGLSGTGIVSSWLEFTISFWGKTETPDQVSALTSKLKIILTFDLPLIAQWIFNSFYAKKIRFSIRAYSALLCSPHLPWVSCTLEDFCSSPGNTGWCFSGSKSS